MSCGLGRYTCGKVTIFVALTASLAGCMTPTPIESEFRTAPMYLGYDATVPNVPFAVDSSYRYVGSKSLADAKKQNDNGLLVAWSRYLVNHAGADTSHTVLKELRLTEVAFLTASHVPLIPIYMPAQQILKGSEASGAAAATEAENLIDAIASPSHEQKIIMIFLDVEGTQPVSNDFLLGWCKGLRDYQSHHVQFQPAIYTNAGPLGQSTRLAINAIRPQCQIKGLWYARYVATKALPTAWPDFNESLKHEVEAVPDVPVYLWQYYEDAKKQMDFNLINPTLTQELVARSLTR